MSATDAGRSETLAKDGKTKADAIVEEQCIVPLRKAAGQEVPTIAISSEFVMNRSSVLPIRKKSIAARRGYEYTVSNLVKLTQDLVREQFPMEASVVPVISAIAQRANPGVKIEGCIEWVSFSHSFEHGLIFSFKGRPNE